MGGRKLQLNLYGAFSCKLSGGSTISVRSAKHRALIALLAMAANGTHTRSWIQETLWKRSGEKHGRDSLRRALSDLKRTFGADFELLFDITNIDICLRPACVELQGDRRCGEFLEGIDIPETGFRSWLAEKRSISAGELLSLRVKDSTHLTPSIAVIPFLPRVQDHTSTHFSDLIALEITRTLSRSQLVNVISHLSSRQFSSHQMNLDEVKSALGIDYLVYGTISIDGNKFRVDADFVESRSGLIRWSRTFEGELHDVLNGQNYTVVEISKQIGNEILSASIELATTRPMPQIESHALLMSSIGFMHQHKLASFSRARTQLEELIEREPENSSLHAWLGKWYILSVFNGWANDPARDAMLATDSTARALDIDPRSAFSLTIDGFAHNNLLKRMDIADERYSQALTINPNESLSWLLKGMLHAFKNEADDAVSHVEKAGALSPLDPFGYFYDSLSASAHLAAENYPRALELSERSLTINSRHLSTVRARITALHFLGRREEANAAAQKLMRQQPDCTVSGYLKDHPAADFKLGKNVADALLASGVPQGEK